MYALTLEEVGSDLLNALADAESLSADRVAELASSMLDRAKACGALAQKASRPGPKPGSRKVKPPSHVNELMAAALPPDRWPKGRPGRPRETPFSDQVLMEQVQAGRELFGFPSDVAALRYMVDARWRAHGMNRTGGNKEALIRRCQQRLSVIRKSSKDHNE